MIERKSQRRIKGRKEKFSSNDLKASGNSGIAGGVWGGERGIAPFGLPIKIENGEQGSENRAHKTENTE